MLESPRSFGKLRGVSPWPHIADFQGVKRLPARLVSTSRYLQFFPSPRRRGYTTPVPSEPRLPRFSSRACCGVQRLNARRVRRRPRGWRWRPWPGWVRRLSLELQPTPPLSDGHSPRRAGNGQVAPSQSQAKPPQVAHGLSGVQVSSTLASSFSTRPPPTLTH